MVPPQKASSPASETFPCSPYTPSFAPPSPPPPPHYDSRATPIPPLSPPSHPDSLASQFVQVGGPFNVVTPGAATHPAPTPSPVPTPIFPFQIDSWRRRITVTRRRPPHTALLPRPQNSTTRPPVTRFWPASKTRPTTRLYHHPIYPLRTSSKGILGQALLFFSPTTYLPNSHLFESQRTTPNPTPLNSPPLFTLQDPPPPPDPRQSATPHYNVTI